MTSKIKKYGTTIEWHTPEGQITPFATHMVVQIIENEFKISFFEVKPSILLDDLEPLPDKVRADCVASVFVTENRLSQFIEVLQGQLNKIRES